MFPLGTVLFPHAPLSLHVFEPRYRMLVHDVLRHDGEFAVVLIERGSEVGGGDVRFDVGTVARVVRAVELGDGRFGIDCVGIERIRVERWLPDDPYPQAEVVFVGEPAATASSLAMRASVEGRLRDVLALGARLDPRRVGGEPALDDLDADHASASYQMAASAPLGSLDAQRVLEARGVDERFALLDRMLDESAFVLRARLGESS